MAATKRATRKGEPAEPEVCPVGFCPVGMFLTFAGQARPEVLEHMMNAGREMVLAAAALMGARADQLRERPRLERIPIDEQG